MVRGNRKTSRPNAARPRKPISAPSRPIAAARSMLRAPMFWPTRVEIAIDSPIAGIMTTCSTFEPTP